MVLGIEIQDQTCMIQNLPSFEMNRSMFPVVSNDRSCHTEEKKEKA